MSAIRKPCAGGCGRLVDKGKSRCPKCARLTTGQRGTSAEWRRQRGKALRRDNWRCVRCQSRHLLEVHHIDGNPANNDLFNLETLCYQHHHEHHDSRRKPWR